MIILQISSLDNSGHVHGFDPYTIYLDIALFTY